MEKHDTVCALGLGRKEKRCDDVMGDREKETVIARKQTRGQIIFGLPLPPAWHIKRLERNNSTAKAKVWIRNSPGRKNSRSQIIVLLYPAGSAGGVGSTPHYNNPDNTAVICQSEMYNKLTTIV